jgi:hypothetical protein
MRSAAISIISTTIMWSIVTIIFIHEGRWYVTLAYLLAPAYRVVERMIQTQK